MPLVLDLDLQLATVEQGFTQSELSLKDECAMRWNLRYNNRLTRNDYFDWNLHVGQAWHNFQEAWRRSKGVCEVTKSYAFPIPKDVTRDEEFDKSLEYWETILPHYQYCYAQRYAEEAKLDYKIIEEERCAEIEGVLIRGKLDLQCDSPFRFIRDFKSTSSAWFLAPEGWHFKLQFMLYCWLIWKTDPEWASKPFDFQLDIMQRPALKHTAKESWGEHLQRVKANITERMDFYFTRKSSTITEGQIMRFEETVLRPKIQSLIVAEANPILLQQMNTNACFNFGRRCEFFEICDKGWDAGKFFFHQADAKHRELE